MDSVDLHRVDQKKSPQTLYFTFPAGLDFRSAVFSKLPNGKKTMTRPLVLSGGGAVGIAWENGVATVFARGGVDLRKADFINRNIGWFRPTADQLFFTSPARTTDLTRTTAG